VAAPGSVGQVVIAGAARLVLTYERLLAYRIEELLVKKDWE
jgi:hypothetical protein